MQFHIKIACGKYSQQNLYLKHHRETVYHHNGDSKLAAIYLQNSNKTKSLREKKNRQSQQKKYTVLKMREKTASIRAPSSYGIIIIITFMLMFVAQIFIVFRFSCCRSLFQHILDSMKIVYWVSHRFTWFCPLFFFYFNTRHFSVLYFCSFGTLSFLW